MYKALERRLPQQHPMLEKVQTQLKREIAGEKGQQALKFPLSFHFTSTSSPIILHNLRLEDENGFFEIDALLICEQFIVLLEAKNWYGTLYVDGERQVIRVGDDNMEEGMPNPFSQVKLQKHRLQKYLLLYFPKLKLPIFYFIVLGFPTTIVKAFNPTQDIPGQLIHSHELPWKLQMLSEASPALAASSIDIDHMIKKLLVAHVPDPTNMLERFPLTVQDLIKGVFCSKCHVPKMNKSQKGWLCTKCQHLSKDAHIQTLLDFQLLLGKRITNQQARAFLNMTSSHAVKRILQKAGSAVGRTRARVYELNL